MRCIWESAARMRLDQLRAAEVTRLRSSITAFFPAYNDAPTIGTLVDYTDALLDRLTPDYEIIVVNDGSRDDTAQVLETRQRQLSRLKVVHHPQNRGYGAALRSGFAAATKEWIFYTDGDGQYDPTELLDLLPHRETADLVNGYKTARGDGLHRAVIGRTYSLLTRAAFGLQVRDVDCDFRLMRRALVAKQQLTSDSGSICVELVHSLQRAGARIHEVSVSHYPRVAGRSQFLRPPPVLQTLGWLARFWLQDQRLRRRGAAGLRSSFPHVSWLTRDADRGQPSGKRPARSAEEARF